MVTSELASCDLGELRAEGLCPTDEDVIRLHALALRITDGPETTAANFPRFALVGGVVLYEPTLAAHYFYERSKAFSTSPEDDDWFFVFALANGRRPRYLDTLDTEDAMRDALGRFKSGIGATPYEVMRAVNYVTGVSGFVEPAKTPLMVKADAKKSQAERERENFAKLEDTLSSACAATGLSYDDIMAQTRSRLVAMVHAANVQAGLAMSASSAAAHADYLATLDEIRKRLTAEKAAKEAANDGK